MVSQKLKIQNKWEGERKSPL